MIRYVCALISFCTLFDSHYLIKGLTLYRSLIQSGDQFTLYIFCFDEKVYQLLERLNLPHVILISLKEFETLELVSVKWKRTAAEYCWTCTPHIIDYCLTRFKLSEVTYLDADLYFFGAPSTLLAELHSHEGSVLLTPHRYWPKYDQSQVSGKYCVQFQTFSNDECGLKALRWWKEKCLDWCYARPESGRFGDQKYLDEFQDRFKRVHVLEHLGGGVAPWNVQWYKVGPGPSVDRVPIIFYHFHGLKIFKDQTVLLCCGNLYRLDRQVINFIYTPYILALKRAFEEIRQIDPSFHAGLHDRSSDQMGVRGKILGRLRKTYQVASLC